MTPRRSDMVEVDLLDVVETLERLARQALGKHVVMHGCRREEEHSFRDTENRLEYMGEIREVLELEKGAVPDYTTLTDTASRAFPDVQCHARWGVRVLLTRCCAADS